MIILNSYIYGGGGAQTPGEAVPEGDTVNIGVCASSWNGTTRDRCNYLGVSHVRIDGGLQWHNIEQSQGVYNWNNLDTFITQNVADGRDVIWIVDYNNPVYGAPLIDGYYGTGLVNTTMRGAYRDFCVAAVNHVANINGTNYLSNVTFELWNESDIWIYWKDINGNAQNTSVSGPEFAAAINLTVPSMKTAQPSCKITTFASNYPTAFPSDITQQGGSPHAYYASSCAPNVDSGVWSQLYSWGCHPYQQGSQYNAIPETSSSTEGSMQWMYQNSRDAMEYWGMPSNIRTWITELGYNTGTEADDYQISTLDYLCRNILMFQKNSIANFSAFSLDGTGWYGIWDQGGTTRRENFKELCQALNGTVYDSAPVNSGGNYVLKFISEAQIAYAYWTTGSQNNKTVDGHTFTLQTAPQYSSYPNYPSGGGDPPDEGSYLLDSFTGIIAAYALTKLYENYAGSCLKIRRASDNATQDIGWDGVNIDQTSLESFCSGTNGYVHTFYDQSGNSRNLPQTTSSLQPQLVQNGTMNTNGLYYYNEYLMGGDWDSNYIGIATRCVPDTADVSDRYIVQKNNYSGWALGAINKEAGNSMRFTTNTGGFTDLDNTSIVLNATNRVIADYNGTTQRLRVNGNQQSVSTSGAIDANNENVYNGICTIDGNYRGYMDFLVLKNTAFTAQEVTDLENYME